MAISMHVIGVVHSPWKRAAEMPIQPQGASGVEGHVEVLPQYAAGLRDLDGFSHIYLIYHFHRAGSTRLTVTPFLDQESRGVFATRAPVRPNAIGLSVVRLVAVTENILTVEDIDVLDGTPLLDIKPYVTAFDVRPVERSGWMTQSPESVAQMRSDQRFVGA
jgi:tRNA-Thr(GGU) m(6)t(6)A37 methyltransferase TsaA